MSSARRTRPGPRHADVLPERTAAGAPPADVNALDAAGLAGVGRTRRRRRRCTLGGVPVPELAAEHGTPAFFLDEDDLRARAARLRARRSTDVDVYYAGKAFLCTARRPLDRRGGPRPGRLHRRRAGRRAARPGFPAERIALARQQQVRRPSCSRRSTPASAASSSTPSTRSTGSPRSPRRGGRRASGCWSGSPSASRRTPTSSSRPRTRTRSSASRCATGPPLEAAGGCSPTPRWSWSACTRTSARRSSTPPASRSPRTGSSALLGHVRDDHGVELAELNLGGGFGIAYVGGDDPRRRSRRSRGCAASSSASARRPGCGCRGWRSSRAGPSSGPAPSPSTRSARSSRSRSTAGATRRLRLGRRRDERQHPHRPLRRQLHLRAGQPRDPTRRRCCAGSSASTARAATSSCATLAARRLRPATCSRSPRPAPTAAAWPATTTTCRGRRWSRCATASPTVIVRRETRGRDLPRAVSDCPPQWRSTRDRVTRPAQVALLGCGVVGSQVVRLLDEQADDLAARIGAPLELAGVAVRRRPRTTTCPPHLLTTDAEALVRRDDIDLVVEVIGGIEPARTLLLTALRARQVRGQREQGAAGRGRRRRCTTRPPRRGVDLYYEAAVAGAIPLLRPLRESLAGDRITRVLGIVNGTTNFILVPHGRHRRRLRRGAGRGHRARLRRGRPDRRRRRLRRRRQGGHPGRLAFHTRVTAADVYREGIGE